MKNSLNKQARKRKHSLRAQLFHLYFLRHEFMLSHKRRESVFRESKGHGTKIPHLIFTLSDFHFRPNGAPCSARHILCLCWHNNTHKSDGMYHTSRCLCSLCLSFVRNRYILPIKPILVTCGWFQINSLKRRQSYQVI